jgi:hypothetical protein
MSLMLSINYIAMFDSWKAGPDEVLMTPSHKKNQKKPASSSKSKSKQRSRTRAAFYKKGRPKQDNR